MIRILICSILALTAYVTTLAQQDSLYYYQFGERVFLEEVEDEYIIEFADTAYSSILDSLQLVYTRLYWNIFQVKSDSATLSQINDSLYTINPLYLREDSSECYLRNVVILEWKTNVTEQTKQNLINHYHMSLSIEAGLLQHYEVDDALEVSSALFETGNFNYCYPEFLVKVVDQDYIPNDEYFNQQWYLHNTGQLTNDGHYGVSGADINAPAAWEITTGSEDIVVAVVDRGVTPDHSDLPLSRLVIDNTSNYDFWDGFEQNQPFASGNNHGNAVSGIIAANIDNITKELLAYVLNVR